jgi:lipoprotein-anchoring transpeptidase ErfK/SrfK
MTPVRSALVLCAAASLAVGCRREEEPTAAAAATVASATVATTGPRPRAEGADPPTDLPELPRLEGAPLVGLDGSARPLPPPLPDGAPRLAAVAMETPVLASPDAFAPRLGLLRAGAIVAMDPHPVAGKGCAVGFRKIEPLGFVCLGSATLDLAQPIVRASTRRPDVTQKLPYIYGTVVHGGPAYARIPLPDEVKELEPHLAAHLAKWRRDAVNGAPYGVELWGKWKREPPPPAAVAFDERRTDADIPWFLQNGLRTPNLSGIVSAETVKAGELARHHGIAFIDSFLWQGRRWNVSVDLRVMPADRFRPIRGSDFHGFRIPEEVKLPFAIVKSKKARRLDDQDGKLLAGDPVPWRSAIAITGRQRVQKGRYYDELEDGGWIADDEVARVELAKKFPGWANDGEKWIDVNVTRQALTLYEGTRPVYATLVSTGEAGLDDPKTTRATARGIFRIHTKHVTATMDSKVVGEEFELRDVPYVQYFHEGYALHAAYWHDVFGQPKSHGCINLAPEDARRIFFWTEPQVPAGWHAASKALKGTVVFIHT